MALGQPVSLKREVSKTSKEYIKSLIDIFNIKIFGNSLFHSSTENPN